MFVCCVSVWVTGLPWSGYGSQRTSWSCFLPYTGWIREWTQVSGSVGIAFTCKAISVAEISPVYTCGPSPVQVCLYWVAVSFFFCSVVGKEYRQTTVLRSISALTFDSPSWKWIRARYCPHKYWNSWRMHLPYWWFCFRKYGRTVGRGHLTTVWKQIRRSNW